MKRFFNLFTTFRYFSAALLFLVLLSACKKNNSIEASYDSGQAYTLQSISYGSDGQQTMDVYLPANRTDSTKVFVLIHGGAWSAGDKADFTYLFNNLKTLYPNHAIINLNYRLATSNSPAYPKQINDIQAALNEISLSKYGVSSNFFLFGNSAGGHLATLYAYGFDPDQHVKGICNTVGSIDFTDTSYLNNPFYASFYTTLLGANPSTALIQEASPVYRITSAAPPTISFYGNADPLIPSTQMGILQNALTSNGVYNECTMYQGGHGDWSGADAQDYALKTMTFINTYFP